MYQSYTDQIISSMNLSKEYEILTFTLRVDGSGYIYVKHNNKIFEKIFTYDEMKLSVKYWADLLPKIIHNYFYGWAVKKGLR